MTRLTDEQVMSLLRSDGPYQRAHREFSRRSGQIDQAQRQREGLSPIELCRMEFEAVEAILEATGLYFESGAHVADFLHDPDRKPNQERQL